MGIQTKFEDVARLRIGREGLDDLLDWLKTTDFYVAPASTKYHECYESGLVEHSLRVYGHLCHLFQAYPINVTPESIAIVSLFHDLCKIGCYKKEQRWRKNQHNQWEQYPIYTFKEDFAFGGHGSKSVYLVQHFMKLEPEEASAINCHMGVENGKWEVLEAHRRNPLAFLLHTADMASTIPSLNEGEDHDESD